MSSEVSPFCRPFIWGTTSQSERALSLKMSLCLNTVVLLNWGLWLWRTQKRFCIYIVLTQPEESKNSSRRHQSTRRKETGLLIRGRVWHWIHVNLQMKGKKHKTINTVCEANLCFKAKSIDSIFSFCILGKQPVIVLLWEKERERKKIKDIDKKHNRFIF